MWTSIASTDTTDDGNETVEIDLQYVRRSDAELTGDSSGNRLGDNAIKGGNSSIPLAIFNFTNSIVGAGLIGIPYVS
jgi:hypothetical protein